MGPIHGTMASRTPRSTPMSKAKLQAAIVGGTADDTENAFYQALQTGDTEHLMGCWADEDDVVCIHPGGPRLVGLASIRAAFEAMFANGSIRAYPPMYSALI
eukprot:Opistho-1_new@1247